MRRAAWLVGLAAALAGCALAPPSPALPARSAVSDFALDGRFALRATLPEREAQSSSGRLSWQHTTRGDRVLLANPLGYGVAEIEMTAELARLRLADGQIREASDPADLIEQVTGQRWPLARLADWLLGRPGPVGVLSQDAQGRPGQLREGTWQIDYDYADDMPEALPARVTLRQAGQLELRLRIEEWKTLP